MPTSSTNSPATTVKTTCPYCGVGCGVIATVDAAKRTVEVAGDPDHPANLGRLCSKGSALAQTVGIEGRLTHPSINGQRVDWDTITSRIADKLQHILQQHGPDAIQLYVSGQLLTEDYYVANKFMKGFIGSNNIDSNSRLCMSSAVAGYKRAFGSDTVPVTYTDLEDCDLLVMVGANLSWCHPVLFQRIKAAQLRDHKKIVVIDPRVTDSCSIANLHLPIKGGTDTVLFNGLLRYLAVHGFAQPAFLTHVAGLAPSLAAAEPFTVEKVASDCAIGVDLVLSFFELFANTPKVVTAFSMGVNQSSTGTDKVNSIINCHLLTGRIGQVGMGPFSITGQPNAMGGREVGALSNLLAAHFDLTQATHRQHVAEFWQVPANTIGAQAGLTATEVPQALVDGRIKAIWIMATNPAVSLPNANLMQLGLSKCDTVIVSDCIADTQTTRLANYLLPAQGWSEKDGTVTNSERVISRQRQFFPAHQQAMPDWWIICQVAQKMGFAGFDYTCPADIFKEHAALSNYHNNGSRNFSLGAMAALSAEYYGNMAPVKWPIAADGVRNIQPRFFAHGRGDDPTAKLHMLAINPQPPVSQRSTQYPLTLNTGRLRDQWHTMTRTGLSARLNQHMPEPLLHIHPQDATLYKLVEGQFATVASALGQVVLKVKCDANMRQGDVFTPIHWSINAKQATVGTLIAPNIDAVSKQPELKFTAVNITPLSMQMHGFILLKGFANSNDTYSANADYWVLNRGANYTVIHLAWAALQRTQQLQQALAAAGLHSHNSMVYHDANQSVYRLATFAAPGTDGAGLLTAVAFFAPIGQPLPELTWLGSLFSSTSLSAQDRKCVLIGKPAEGYIDVGRTICSCFTVGENTIVNAIKTHNLSNAGQIGACLKAGTNCGSCVPELNSILKRCMPTGTG